jgi:hypothetical protein
MTFLSRTAKLLCLSVVATTAGCPPPQPPVGPVPGTDEQVQVLPGVPEDLTIGSAAMGRMTMNNQIMEYQFTVPEGRRFSVVLESIPADGLPNIIRGQLHRINQYERREEVLSFYERDDAGATASDVVEAGAQTTYVFAVSAGYGDAAGKRFRVQVRPH